MSLLRKISDRRKRRTLHVRAAIKESGLPRVSVFRSALHIYGQLIDDNAQKTLVAASSLKLNKIKGDKKAVAHAVGVELAKKALEKNISQAAFDRGPFLYHGRVKAFAEGLREGGLKI